MAIIDISNVMLQDPSFYNMLDEFFTRMTRVFNESSEPNTTRFYVESDEIPESALKISVSCMRPPGIKPFVYEVVVIKSKSKSNGM